MKKPIIGITGNQKMANNGNYPPFEINYSPTAYGDAVVRAGGLPMVIPISDPEDAVSYISSVDGIILTGGQDVSPALYHQEPHLKLEATSWQRDQSEVALIKEAIRQQKPILAICRGLQLVNVVFGGTLYQDLPSQYNVTVQHSQKSQPENKTHSIHIEPNSHLSEFLQDGICVNSIHHQAVDQLGEGLKVTARSHDDVVEAFESTESNLIVAVQWHPEELAKSDDNHLALFEDLVRRAQK